MTPQPSISRLLGHRGNLITAPVVVATALAGVGFWFLAAVVNAALFDRSFVEELVHPSLPQAWIRILVALLIGLVYLERRARRQLALLWFVLDEAPDGIQIADLSGRIAYSNRAVQDIYGFTPEELLGRNVNEMNADSTVADRVILPALEKSGRWTGELLVKHKDGRTFPIWLTSAVVIGGRGRPSAALGIIRDISARKRAQDELRRYASELEEATRLKDLFSDILRHDLLGPASVLRVSLDMLRKQRLEEPTARLAAQASRSCARLIEMLEHAAQYARLSSTAELQFEPLELRTLLSKVIADHDALLAERGVHVVLDALGTYPLRGNPLLADVFANLLSNAIKYGPKGGTIRIGLRDDADRWTVSVADEGEGIAPADRERIFTRFERLGKEGVQGSGLGLAIAQQLVALHQGTIAVEGEPGGGAVFRVSLPKR